MEFIGKWIVFTIGLIILFCCIGAVSFMFCRLFGWYALESFLFGSVNSIGEYLKTSSIVAVIVGGLLSFKD